MFGDFPPSSSEIFFTVLAAFRMTDLPTSVEPVNAILSTSGLVARYAPRLLPGPDTTFITPAGAPASSTMRPSSSDVTGVYCDGFTTSVHPAHSAGATFHVSSRNGKFHGVITPTTPSGSRTVSPMASGVKLVIDSPFSSSARPAKYSNTSAAMAISAAAIPTGRPTSSDNSLPSCGICALIFCATFVSTSWRVFADDRLQPPSKARRAAWMARSMSGSPAHGQVATTSPFAGLRRS